MHPSLCLFLVPCHRGHLPDALVGRKLKDGSWVKTILEPMPRMGNMDTVVVAKGEGFKLPTRIMSVDDVITQLADDHAL